MAPTVEKLPIPSLKLGEGPHWDVPSQSLYLVDIDGSALIRYDSKSNRSYVAKLDIPSASFIIPEAGSSGHFVVGSGTNLYLVKWDGCSDKVESAQIIHSLANESKENRINDGKCDPSGRLWFGTMKSNDAFTLHQGKFYSYSKEEGYREHASGIGISNGLTWDGNRMYYIDSVLKAVDCFDYNRNGNIENRRTIFDLRKYDMCCFPDGMTIDKDGKLWVACFEGSQVIHIDPTTGELLNTIPIPTSQVTSVAWGGPDFDQLYVTTANVHPEGGIQPDAGSTFRISGLSTHGLPMNEFSL